MKILLALAVALTSFTGCATRPDVGRIRIEVFDNLRQFKLVNETGRDLHNVKVGAWIYTGGKMIPAPNKRVGDWPNGGEFPGQYRFAYGLQKLDVDGTCDEGKFRSIWVEGIEPVEPKTETKAENAAATIVFTLKGQPPNWTVENNSSVTVHKVKAICAFRGSSGI